MKGRKTELYTSDGGGEGTAEPAGLYVHVPFCSSKCPYCDFNSVAVSDGSFEERRFIDCLFIELDTVLEVLERTCFTPATLYFGGGTPGLLSPASIARFIRFLKDKGNGALPGEITMEVNPESVTAEKLAGYFTAGVNRISIGVQSFNDHELLLLGRPHTVREAVAAFRAARRAGFGNIGIDLIFGTPRGVPGKELDDWKRSLASAIELSPEHISLYGLTIEAGTPFYSTYSTGVGANGCGVSDELYIELYNTAIDLLTGAGYEQYEISNFSLSGLRSRHNSLNWSGAEYIGLGPGAHSLFKDSQWGRRSWNVKEVRKYMNIVEGAGCAVEQSEPLTKESAQLESIMLGLRLLKSGIEAQSFNARFGAGSFTKLIETDKVKGFIAQGLLYRAGDGLRLTRKGALLSDTVIAGL